MIPFSDLKSQYRALKPSIDARIARVLEHSQFVLGPEVGELEIRLAEFSGARHCVTVASGTDALLLALLALEIDPGDEVITSPCTFVASAEAIVRAGAVPVFADVEPDTGNIAVPAIEAALTSRTRAIMPVSLYGQPADMDEINALAQRHGLAVIEDAAQSFGASYRGRRSCNLSTVGCTSFYPSKPLGCYGDGGALFTDDDALARAARVLRDHGQEARYLHTRVGLNSRMDALQCAVVLAKLERFPWELEQRQVIAQRYHALMDAAGVARMGQREDRQSVFAQYTVLVDERDAVRMHLQEAGIPTAVHYPVPLDAQPAYRRFARPGACPQAAALCARVLSLPMSADLRHEHQLRIAEALAVALRSPAGATARQSSA